VKGHRSGWCWHQFQARFNGERPAEVVRCVGPARPLSRNTQLAQEPRNRLREQEGSLMAKKRRNAHQGQFADSAAYAALSKEGKSLLEALRAFGREEILVEAHPGRFVNVRLTPFRRD
jgi:hypothetical protein